MFQPDPVVSDLTTFDEECTLQRIEDKLSKEALNAIAAQLNGRACDTPCEVNVGICVLSGVSVRAFGLFFEKSWGVDDPATDNQYIERGLLILLDEEDDSLLAIFAMPKYIQSQVSAASFAAMLLNPLSLDLNIQGVEYTI